ncbi:hypothetical protein WJX73_010153 [Symbiochloris irregularis]|uniref:Sulfotransferase n=1 Tax=Symbiochloris irregularis TaxID=706552 RepID=A0AAW1PVL6_9CHLO
MIITPVPVGRFTQTLQHSPASYKLRCTPSRSKMATTAVSDGHQHSLSVPEAVTCQQWHHQGRCFDGECEGLHLLSGEVEEQQQWHTLSAERPGRLIVAAGPERSGSTWLYNAVRLLYWCAKKPLHAYWLHTVTDRKLQQRQCGCKGAADVLVKTHCWSDRWDPAHHTHKIFVTHRDLGEVVSSYQRLGWAFDISNSYVHDHQRWKEVSQRDIAFEDIIQKPREELQALAEELGLDRQVDIAEVHQQLNALKPPDSGPPDPVTKLWARHLSPQVLAQLAGSGSAQHQTRPPSNEQLRARFPVYYQQYGY